MGPSDLSIVVQGPWHPGCRANVVLPAYMGFGKVVVSCWSVDNMSSLSKFGDKITRVANRYEDIPEMKGLKYGPGTPPYYVYQYFNTLNGLRAAGTRFSIKVRSDQSYSNLKPLIDRMTEFQDKMVTSNVWFRYSNGTPFHPSDHVIGARTDLLIDTFERCIARFLSGECPKAMGSPSTAPRKYEWLNYTEQNIGASFLEAKGVFPDRAKAREIMQEHFDIVPIYQMGDFLCKGINPDRRVCCHDIKDV